MIRIFIGFDAVEEIAWHALTASIIHRCSQPVAIIPIKRTLFTKFHDRPIDPKQSNEFAFTRWLTPFLAGYEGRAIFMDCDMMFMDDPAKLWEEYDPRYAVQVVKHDYTPATKTKFLGTTQYAYPMKNWSSVMLFNCAKCEALTPDYVNTASGLDLHQFKWLPSADLIGTISPEWNHLVGEYEENPKARNVHWTIGGPYFHEWEDTEYCEEWFAYRDQVNNCVQRKKNVGS